MSKMGRKKVVHILSFISAIYKTWPLPTAVNLVLRSLIGGGPSYLERVFGHQKCYIILKEFFFKHNNISPFSFMKPIRRESTPIASSSSFLFLSTLALKFSTIMIVSTFRIFCKMFGSWCITLYQTIFFSLMCLIFIVIILLLVSLSKMTPTPLFLVCPYFSLSKAVYLRCLFCALVALSSGSISHIIRFMLIFRDLTLYAYSKYLFYCVASFLGALLLFVLVSMMLW